MKLTCECNSTDFRIYDYHGKIILACNYCGDTIKLEPKVIVNENGEIIP